jgi:hypothetical protein
MQSVFSISGVQGSQMALDVTYSYEVAALVGSKQQEEEATKTKDHEARIESCGYVESCGSVLGV